MSRLGGKTRVNIKRLLDDLFKNANDLVSEDDCAEAVVIPLLKALGHMDISRKVTVPVPTGEKVIFRQADIIIRVKGQPRMVVETKRLTHKLDDEDTSQVLAYAELLDCRFAVLTNGRVWEVTDRVSFTTGGLADLPDAAALLAHKTTANKSLDVRQRLAARLAYTLENKDKLGIAFGQAREALARHGLIAGEAFDELTKLLVCKFNEERRQAQTGVSTRFTTQWLEGEGPMHALRQLLVEARSSFPVFPTNTTFNFSDNALATELVSLLQPFGFVGVSGPIGLLGAGGDVIGSVYEKFLSGTLKGELGQYLTPRPIVDFMIDIANIQASDRVLDLSCGSGGFLIRFFLVLRRAIQSAKLTEAEKTEALKRLVNDQIWGIEINPRLANLCRINMILHGDGFENIYTGDSVSSSPVENREKTVYLSDYEQPDMPKFDAILMNPPFNRPYTDAGVLNDYDLGRGRSSQGSDWLMLERAMRLLSKSGRIVIVLPYRIINGVEQEDVRTYITQHAQIAASVSLPVGAFKPFGGSNARTTILVLTKKKSKKRFLARAEKLGYDLGSEAYRPVIEDSDLSEIADAYKALVN
jgi:type I restriction enzyme M protein